MLCGVVADAAVCVVQVLFFFYFIKSGKLIISL
jgi:hypothetical protein